MFSDTYIHSLVINVQLSSALIKEEENLSIKQKLVSRIIILSLFITSLIFGSITYANENIFTVFEELTENERMVLIHKAGLAEDRISQFPNDFLREMIEKDAVIIKYGEPKIYDVVEKIEKDGSNKTRNSSISLQASIWEVNSDIPGRRKFILWGRYDWINMPFFRLRDKMSYGYPESNEWVYPTSGGVVQGHRTTFFHRFSNQYYVQGNGIFVPSSATPGLGIATHFPLQSQGTYPVVELWGTFSQEILYI